MEQIAINRLEPSHGSGDKLADAETRCFTTMMVTVRMLKVDIVTEIIMNSSNVSLSKG